MVSKEGLDTNYISTSHELARELKSRNDGFIFAKVRLFGEEYECVIDSIGRTPTHGNLDDMSTHYVLNMRECSGNIKR